MPSVVWNEIIYPFSNINGCTVEVWEWISNFIPPVMMDVITYAVLNHQRKWMSVYPLQIWHNRTMPFHAKVRFSQCIFIFVQDMLYTMVTLQHATHVHVGVWPTVYPKKYAHGFVVLCFVVVMQSFIINSHEVFIHIHQGCFAGTGAIVRLPQCQ